MPSNQDAITARNDAISAFEDAGQHDSVAEVASAEQDAADKFLSRLAECVVDGLSATQAKQHCDVVADAAKHYNKTTLVELLEEKIEDTRDGAAKRRPFNEIIKQDLEAVVVVRTTDSKQSATYRWQFQKGTVETSSTAEGRVHFSWNNFRDEYYAATGEDPGRPPKTLRSGEEWREFLVDIVEERGQEVTTRGPRTVAVDTLQNFIRRTDAFGRVEDMVERDGLYLDSDPAEAEPSEIWVPNHHIKRICDEAELNSTRDLQVELGGRGLTSDRVAGVSESTFVNGNKVTYWVLDPAIADPAGYTDEPLDPADQLRQEEQEDEEEEDDEPGKLGSIGGDDE